MHELSIVCGIVSAVEESLAGRRVSRVYSVKLQLGALSGVVEEALNFSYGLATQGTILEGSRLEIHHIPLVIHCDVCHRDQELAGVQTFRCPACGTPSLDVRSGRELEIESLEVEEET